MCQGVYKGGGTRGEREKEIIWNMLVGLFGNDREDREVNTETETK